jgi:DNA-binding response OmpR family regulator
MPVLKDRNIILIANSPKIKSLIRTSLERFPESKLRVVRSINSDLCKYTPSILFIHDKNISNVEIFSTILRDIRRICNFHCVLITEGYDSTNIIEMFESGIDYILESPINPHILDALLSRYLNKLKEGNQSTIHRRGVSLFIDSNFVTYKNCKIHLTDTEKLILHSLMDRDTLTQLDLLKNILEDVKKKSISESYIRVNISRIRAKFVKATGLNIIGNVYSKGYFLNI